MRLRPRQGGPLRRVRPLGNGGFRERANRAAKETQATPERPASAPQARALDARTRGAAGMHAGPRRGDSDGGATRTRRRLGRVK